MSAPYQELHFAVFITQYRQLLMRLQILLQNDPNAFPSHPDTKFFKQLRSRMDVAVADPEAPEYLLGDVLAKQRYKGKPLGRGYGSWRRIKNGMPDRYRLFFQFLSADRELIFAWLNDQRSIRRDDDKMKDVYAMFAKLLASDSMPNAYKALRAKSTPHASSPAESRLQAGLD